MSFILHTTTHALRNPKVSLISHKSENAKISLSFVQHFGILKYMAAATATSATSSYQDNEGAEIVISHRR